MISVGDIKNIAPTMFQSKLQEKVYAVLDKLSIPFERVDTDEAITMENCIQTADLATSNGADTIITNGKETLYEIIKEKSVGTLFAGKEQR